MAQNRNETVQALLMGECNLVYTKLTGEQRIARGTLSGALIPQDKLPKNGATVGEKKTDEDAQFTLIHYFDLDANGWRCFLPVHLQSLSVVNL